jgi:hypothetical protein
MDTMGHGSVNATRIYTHTNAAFQLRVKNAVSRTTAPSNEGASRQPLFASA